MIGTGYLIGGAAALSAVLSFGAAWQIQGWRQDAARYAAAQDLAQSQRDNAKLVDRAAEAYQTTQASAEVRERVVEKEVIRVVQKPVYRERCLDDDGLRIVADDIDAANARRGIAPAVPASAASR